MCSASYINSQNNDCPPDSLKTVKLAKFGIDADIISGVLSFGDSIDTDNDDWFQGSSGNGNGVINISDTTAIKKLKSGDNIYEVFRMSKSFNTEFNDFLWHDAAYIRDYYSINQKKDSTIFGGGDDKNYDNPNSWSIKAGSVPAKNDIIDVYSHLRKDLENDSLWLFGAAYTLSQNGDNYIDFEYYREAINYEDGKLITEDPSGHSAYTFNSDGQIIEKGDFILSINYTNGGSSAEYKLYIWIEERSLQGMAEDTLSFSEEDLRQYNDQDSIPFHFGDEKGSIEYYPQDNDPNSGFGYARISICVNNKSVVFSQDNYNAPPEDPTKTPSWGTIGANGEVQHQYDSPNFIEFGFNMTALGLNGLELHDQCYSPLGHVLVKTRASNSFTSELKDFAGPFTFGNIPPNYVTIECPPKIEVDCLEDIPEPDTSLVVITNIGEGGDPVIQHVSDVSDNQSCPETITRTYSATDDCGNVVYCSQTIIVNDTIEPEIEDVPDYMLEACNAPWPNYLTSTWSDNCDEGGEIISDEGVDDGQSEDGCYQYRLYTFTVTDSCGNTDTETTRVAREYDMTDPEIIDVPDYMLEICNDEIISDEGVEDGQSDDGCYQYRLYTFTVTDSCGNTDTETTRVTREYDMTNPEIVDIPNYMLEVCNAPWPEYLTSTWSDNCDEGGEIMSDNGVDLESNEEDGCLQYRMYTFTITDHCGNTSSESTIVTRIYDILNPEIDDKADFTLTSCNEEWPEYLMTTWTDNCDPGGEIISDEGVE
jgi:hypothetical protein